jgi:Na+-driven multidrug efflux pump
MRFNYGAGKQRRLHSAFRYGTALVTGMMILGTLAVILFPAQILGLFTASEAMRSFGISAMRIMAASYLFCGLSTMISTYFQATEKVGSSMAIQLCRQLLFLVPSLWCLDRIVPSERNLACISLLRKLAHFSCCSHNDGLVSP